MASIGLHPVLLPRCSHANEQYIRLGSTDPFCNLRRFALAKETMMASSYGDPGELFTKPCRHPFQGPGPRPQEKEAVPSLCSQRQESLSQPVVANVSLERSTA